MTPFDIGAITIPVVVVLILVGMPIGLLATSFAGVAMIRNETVAVRMVTQVANDRLEQYLFAGVPLIVLMDFL